MYCKPQSIQIPREKHGSERKGKRKTERDLVAVSKGPLAEWVIEHYCAKHGLESIKTNCNTPLNLLYQWLHTNTHMETKQRQACPVTNAGAS